MYWYSSTVSFISFSSTTRMTKAPANSEDGNKHELARAMFKQIHDLTLGLQALLLPSESTQGPSEPGTSTEPEREVPTIGDRVIIITNPHGNKIGTITKKHKVYLEITLDNGDRVRKMPHLVRIYREWLIPAAILVQTDF